MSKEKRRLGPDYNLLVCHPEIAAEWDYDANGDLRPENEYPRSNNMRSWVCRKCGYKWITSIAGRTSQKGGCQGCQNKVVTENNNLAKVRPDVTLEWHPAKNGTLTPFDVVPGANRSVWWLCPYCGHEYPMPVRQKCRGDGCPHCSKNGASPENNLAKKFPEIAAQWHPTKNRDRTPDRIPPASNFRAWWLCDKCGHEWSAKVCDRTNYNTGCNACAGKVATPKHNLAVTHPDLARELHPAKNGNWVAEKLRPGSGREVWWICPLGHEYDSPVVERTAQGRGCPYCSSHRVGYGNSLADSFSDIAKEWHPTNNEGKTPHDVTKFSNQEVWWQCSKRPEHEWKATIATRTFQGSGCPLCSPNISQAELRLFCELKHIFPDAKRSYKDPVIKQECDIFLKRYSVAIEYDGKYHHKDKLESDKNKNQVLSENRILLLRVREKPLPRISDWDVSIDGRKQKALDMVKKVLEALSARIKLSDSEIKAIELYLASEQLVNEVEYQKLISLLPAPPYERSLAFLYQDVADEWDYEANGDLTPTDFYANSTHEAAWVGKDCGHKWEAPIYYRTGSRNGCPYCGRKKILYENSLAAKFSDIAAEWHPSLNGDTTPEMVFPFSTKEAWWINEKRGTFKTEVRNRNNTFEKKPKKRDSKSKKVGQ